MNFIKVIFVCIYFLLACDEKKLIYEEEYIPELDEDIPYEELGSGKILFERISEYGKYDCLYLIDIDKNLYYPIKIFGNWAYEFSLSPDGSKILFQIGTNIFVMNNDGSGLKQLTKLYGYLHPVWHRNSNKIYFIKEQKLYLLNIDDEEGNKRYVTNFAYYDGLGSFIGYLVPLGDYIALSSKEEIVFPLNNPPSPLSKGIYILDQNHYKINLLYSSDSVDFFASPKFSPVDDNKIVFKGIKVDSNRAINSLFIFLLSMENENIDVIFKRDVNCSALWHDYSCWSEYLDFSPDGNKIIFNINENDFESHIYVIDINSLSVFQMTNKKRVSDRHISWSN